MSAMRRGISWGAGLDVWLLINMGSEECGIKSEVLDVGRMWMAQVVWCESVMR